MDISQMPQWGWRLLSRLSRGELLGTDLLWLDAGLIFGRSGMVPDVWQEGVILSSARRVLLLCSRQVGKTTVVADLCLRTAFLEAPATVLVVCPAERQSAEFVRKCSQLYAGWRQPQRLPLELTTAKQAREMLSVPPPPLRESTLQLHLPNGSRIIGLPSKEANIRSYSAINLLVLDEAARIPDETYYSMRPVLAVSQGRVMALSTPYGKRGWFYEEWKRTQGGGEMKWQVTSVTADQCPRLTKEFLDDELESLGEAWFRQEYFCEFRETIESAFSSDSVQKAVEAGNYIEPLW